MSNKLERINAEKGYIGAKLEKFELDGITKPFTETARNQGFVRAVKGSIQKAGLRITGQYDDYVGKKAAYIERERSLVKNYEALDGREVDTRILYHEIRDSSETGTYKDTERAFKGASWDLTKEEANLTNNRFLKFKGFIQHYKTELKGAAIGLATGLLITLPLHHHNEYKDRHRMIHFQKYDTEKTHPLVETAIAASNLEMYLHDIWNNYADKTEARNMVDNWEEVANGGLNDWNEFDEQLSNQPWATLFERARNKAHPFLEKTTPAIQNMSNGASREDSSWIHTSFNQYHTETYSCGTSKNPQTCTRSVYDYTDHHWNLKTDELIAGAKIISEGIKGFPFLARAITKPYIKTSALSEFFKGKTKEEIEEYMAIVNQWEGSIVINGFNNMNVKVEEMDHPNLAEQIVALAPSFPTYYWNRSYSYMPTSYPNGWSEHENLLGITNEAVKNYNSVMDCLDKFDTKIDEINEQMKIIYKNKDASLVNDSLRNLANLGYEIHNTNYSGSDWHPTHGIQLLLEWLIFLGITGSVGFSAYKLLDKYRDNGWEDRMRKAKLYENYESTYRR